MYMQMSTQLKPQLKPQLYFLKRNVHKFDSPEAPVFTLPDPRLSTRFNDIFNAPLSLTPAASLAPMNAHHAAASITLSTNWHKARKSPQTLEARALNASAIVDATTQQKGPHDRRKPAIQPPEIKAN